MVDEGVGIATSVGPYSGRGERILGHLFAEQRALCLDKERFKVARCGRRAGKTTAVAANLARKALNHPGALLGYIAPTRKQAKQLLWKELKRLSRHYQLTIEFNETDLEARVSNGSVIMLAGADKVDSIEKFRGLAFLEVVLDESASFKRHIEDLVEEVLKPTLEDYDGSITLIGSPGKALVGLFFRASTSDSVWSRHHWTVLDNRHFPRWAKRRDWRKRAASWLEQMRKREQWGEDDPTYLREWLGKWVRDDSTLVYVYDPKKNASASLPRGHSWSYVLGVDLGFDDDTAFVVEAFTDDLPAAYIVHAEKRSGMDVEDVAERARELEEKFGGFRSRVIDTGGLGKMVATTLVRKKKIFFKPAEKTHKQAFQADLNADLRKSRIKVLPAAAPIVGEWEQLQKDETGAEDDRFPNHCADAGLYAHRECRHYLWKPRERKPAHGTTEYWKAEEAALESDTTSPDDRDEIDDLFT